MGCEHSPQKLPGSDPKVSHAILGLPLAGITSWDYARKRPNSMEPSETGSVEVNFEFVTAVCRDPAFRLTANRANLLKANVARWKRSAA
jgi:hypothetical protein